MYSFRVTKFDPMYRDSNGVFTREDWTSISDIGKVYNGKIFTIEDYIKMEDAYINAIFNFMSVLNLPYLTIAYMEKHSRELEVKNFRELYSLKMKEVYLSAKKGKDVEKANLELLCRLILREQLWCKLERENFMFVHFGYDYYMYIGVVDYDKKIKQILKKNGLYVEEYQSPYCFE